MAHNINNGNMAYVGERPWHGLGKQVSETVSAAEMISLAGLDWEVEKRAARGARVVKEKPSGLLEDGRSYSRYEIIRKPRKADEEEVVLGTVTNRYELLQNKDAFAFFDTIVDQKRAFFETAGALGDGERIWVMAKMPNDIEVVAGDVCKKYLLLSNTHDGKGSVIVKFTAVRVVCQNTLIMSLEDGQKAFRVRHSKSMSNRLEEIAELIQATTEVYAKAAVVFKKMAAEKMDDKALQEYLEAVYPRTEKQKAEGTESKNWSNIRVLYNTLPNLQLPYVKGTMWAAYNAMTYFEDFKAKKDEEATARLDRVWFGDGADIKLQALLKARDMLGLN